MNLRKALMIVASVVMLAACGNTKPQQLCGGYTEQRELTEEEFAMFNSVTGSGDMSFTPLSVATQVVAGINYRFWCRYQDKENSGHCYVLIYKPLPGQGEPRLTSIDKE